MCATMLALLFTNPGAADVFGNAKEPGFKAGGAVLLPGFTECDHDGVVDQLFSGLIIFDTHPDECIERSAVLTIERFSRLIAPFAY